MALAEGSEPPLEFGLCRVLLLQYFHFFLSLDQALVS